MKKKAKVFWAKGVMAGVEHCEEPGKPDCQGCSCCDHPAKKIEVANPIGAKVGDIVEVELSDSTPLVVPLIAFGIPFVSLLLGLVLAAVLKSDFPQFLVLGGLIIGLVMSLLIDRSFVRSKKGWGRIVRKIIDNG